MNKNPYWHKLISHWVNVEKRNGLTIPFIIGAHQFYDSKKDVEPMTVSQLFKEIISSDTADTMTLLYCDNIGDYVFSLNNSSYKMSGLEIKNELTNKVTLIATLSTQILGKNISDIITSLNNKYANCLQDKKYSLIKSSWEEFNVTDKKMINKAFGIERNCG